MAGYPKPKKYKVRFPKKYIGDPTNVICRSSWETKLCRMCDEKDYIIKWGLELIAIPYISPIDNKMHRYFPDFIIHTISNNEIVKTMIEVKPFSQTIPPKTKNRKKINIINETKTFHVNMAKWDAARKWCEKNNYIFKIFTEKELGIK